MQRPPSLEIVEDIVRHEFEAHARRVDAADTRAGLLLGFSGLLVSLGADGVWRPCAIAARLLAGAAALLTLGTVAGSAQAVVTFNIEQLARTYIDVDPVQTRLRLLENRLVVYGLVRHRFQAKLARLRLASALVMAAVALSVLGATVEVIT